VKGKVFDKFKAYKGLMDNQLSMKIKTLHFNNEKEFMFKKIEDFLHECGIQ
jgi:hypothetical protein